MIVLTTCALSERRRCVSAASNGDARGANVPRGQSVDLSVVIGSVIEIFA